MVIVGTTMTALAFGLLILPKGILAGGVTGCARLISAGCALPVSGIVLVINTGLLIAGYLCMGRAFVMRSVVSTFCFPLALELAQKLTQPEISSTPTAAAAAGALLGIGGALVIIGNGSQGGFGSMQGKTFAEDGTEKGLNRAEIWNGSMNVIFVDITKIVGRCNYSSSASNLPTLWREAYVFCWGT